MTDSAGARILVEDLVHPIGERTLSVPRLEIAPGHVMALVGTNGAGKTTLLRILAGLVTPQRGRVVVEGTPTIVHQKPYLFRGSARFNVALGASQFTDAERYTREALEAVDATHFADRPAPSLSGGEARRVAIARALAMRTRVLLLDEPTTALDPVGREHIELLLRKWRGGRGPTVIWSTPNPPDESLADGVLRIVDGVVTGP